MTIAYGIALSMDWDKPYWAGFAVAFVSLETVGQSMNKGTLRIFGTLVAMAVALTLIALFDQERWLFMLFLSAYMGFCCYMMSGQHAYFWQVCGFVCVVICMDAGADSVNAFQTATQRAQETGLGILVYTLVAMFLWPSRSAAAFNAAATDLAATQLQFYRACLGLAGGQGSAQEAERLSAQQVQQKTRFDQLLDAAETDSYEVWELRRPWRCYQQQVAELMHALERWRENFDEVQALDLRTLLPGLDAFEAELDRRLAQIGELLAGHAPEPVPEAVDLTLDKDAMRSLSHFDRAALVVTRSRMRHLEQLTRSLLGTVSEFRGRGKAAVSADAPRAPSNVWVLDLDRLASAVRLVAILWLAWLAVIYVNDIPNDTGVVSLAASFAIKLVHMPQVSVSDTLVSTQGSVATNLVQVYLALGGGWQIRANRDPVELLPTDMKDEMRERTGAWKRVLE